MISKAASILYLFDFDGTLVGQDKWDGYLKNNFECFRVKFLNPDVFGVRWCILTGRPKMDILFLKLICKMYKFKPQQIFTTPTWRYHFNTLEQVYQSKLKLMKKILDDSSAYITYTPFKIEKIFYIDNDLNCTSYINRNRESYPLMSMTVAEFYKGDFNTALLP